MKKKDPVENARRAAIRKLFPPTVTVAIDQAERSSRRASNPEKAKELYEKTQNARIRGSNRVVATARRVAR